MKNPTSGDLFRDAELRAGGAGRPCVQLRRLGGGKQGQFRWFIAVLRGRVNQYGQSFPNYHYEDLRQLCARCTQKASLKNPAVDHRHQPLQFRQDAGWSRPRIAKDILLQHPPFCRHLHASSRVVMIETYHRGRQPEGRTDGAYGKSITDPCLGWEKTERLVMEIASLR